MAAGLGFKDFTTGEVLTAADVDGYLMQGVWVFASAAARDAAVTSPQEGNFAYLKDTNVTTYYTGSAWANLDTTGMTNPMTTTGDTIYSSSGSTPARLGIGSTGQVLTVAGGIPSWATPASSASMTLINTGGTALSGATTTVSSIPGTYKNLYVLVVNQNNATADGKFRIAPNGSVDKVNSLITYKTSTTAVSSIGTNAGYLITQNTIQRGTDNAMVFVFYDYARTLSTECLISGYSTLVQSNEGRQENYTACYFEDSAITSLVFSNAGGNLSGGTVYVYGVN
jgi:hypothetical protein